MSVLPGHLSFFLLLSSIPIILIFGIIAKTFSLSFDSIVALRKFGSFTRDKTYSYDGKYYVAKFDPSFHEIDIYSSNGYVDAIILPNPGDYYGVCWEKDSYNLWIQEENGDILCYNMADEKWFLNENAVKPDYIICRDVV